MLVAISTRFSDAIHIMAYIDIYQKTKLSSENIAKSVMTSPVVVRRIMSALQKADLIQTTHGSPNPTLAREASDISLLDIYLAVEKDKPLFTVDPKTNPQCIVGSQIQQVLTQNYHEVQAAALGSLARITLQDIIDEIIINYKTAKEN